MQSKITGGNASYLFTAKVLSKYDVKYYRCDDTGFIQTEEPYWLDEAYSSAITALDIGLLVRNNRLSDTIEKIIGLQLNPDGMFLDYAGGYGMFTRLMRDKGYDFFHTDKYCENIFARYFDLSDLPAGQRFEAVTAFELFEHLADPIPEIRMILNYSDTIIFTTELVPGNISGPDDWWYIAPETGQHIAFYTRKALKHIAAELKLQLYSNDKSIHILSAKKLNEDVLRGLNPFGKNKMVRKKSKAYYEKHSNSFIKKIGNGFVKTFEKMQETISGKAVEKRNSLMDKDVAHIKSLLNKK